MANGRKYGILSHIYGKPHRKELLFLDTETPKKRRKLHTEGVLALVALITLAMLLIVLVLCLPYMGADSEDPMALRETLPPVEEVTEPGPTEQEVIPTIPPDRNPLTRADFQYNENNYLLLQRGHSIPGIDVSAFQGKIDWQKVADSGIEFAMIRLGYRGYGQKGTLVEDEYAQDNLKGAREAGLELGAYFFSQATTIEEVDEEIAYMLEILGDTELDMPIVFDWEYISDTARTAHVDAPALTEMTLHFCSVMEENGYEPMIYFNWHQSSTLLYLSELEDYPFWLALYTDRMTYPYKIEMWQYTCTGRVPGITGDVDINVFLP